MQDWIKMRTDLYRDPKISIMANHLLSKDGALAAHVSQNLQCDMAVTRNVMRCATVGATLATWGVMRHRGKRNGDDLECHNVSIEVIDDISDLPGFGEAMEACGWVVAIDGGICFPRFFAEYNVQIDNKGKSSAAERQKKYRDKQKAKRNGERCATGDVTRNGREEERREEILKETPPEPQKKTEQGQAYIPEKVNTPECLRAYEDWCNYLEAAGLNTKNPRNNAIQAEAVWRQASRIGPERWPDAVTFSIANGYQSIINKTDAPGSSSSKTSDKPKGPSLDFLKAVRVCQEYPSASDYDREKRESLLGPDLMRTVRKMGTPRLAECDRFTQGSLSAEWNILRESGP